MPLGTPASATLGEINVGLVAALGVVLPLAAQLDLSLSVGLGPFKAELSAQLNASLSAQASISLQIGDPTFALQLAINAVAQLQAALQAALSLPPISLSLTAELGATAALAGSLSARLGGLSLALEAAIRVKLGALRLAAQLEAHLSAGPVFAFTFGEDTLAATGSQIQALFAAGLEDGSNVVEPGEVVYGVVLLATLPSVSASLSAIITI